MKDEMIEARRTADAFVQTDVTAVQAVTGRHSIRQFKPDPVPEETVREILAGAARAPSGTNTQPWKVRVVMGAARDRVSEAVLAAAEAGEHDEEYAYSPKPIKEPFLARRRAVGYALYSLYGIARDDYPARKAAALRNYTFFGAPVGLFFSMDRELLYGSWLDVGMFMQNVMILARAHGLETCPQQAWCEYAGAVRGALGVPEDEILISGMAMGHADWSAPQNALVSEREPVDGFATFLTE